MKRSTAVFAALLLMVLAAPARTSPAVVDSDLSLQASLPPGEVVAFGHLSPPARRRHIRVRLLVQRADGSFREVARKKVRLKGRTDQNGDGMRDSRFGARFPAPQRESCKVIARFAGSKRRSPARAVKTLPCRRPEFPSGRATLTSVDLDVTRIDVEVADNDELRAFGLMFRRHLGADRGMAFLFDGDTSGGFWMKNTLIPLSIAFFDAQGLIVRILDMEPCDADPCPTYDPDATYRGALEVNQGAFDRWAIHEGDRITVSRDDP